MTQVNISSDEVSNLLDKLCVRQLHLLEEKMSCEINIENSINNGSIHLAKSRYIMGHNSVSTTKLPIDTSPEFSATLMCEAEEKDGVKRLKVVENDAEGTINPIRWFGVLVPQNLHKAKNIFQNTINYVVECTNVQLEIVANMKILELLKKYKSIIETT